jgi:tetratricopeptide (TPR) repeat protein
MVEETAMRHPARTLVTLLFLLAGGVAAAAQDSPRRECAGRDPDRAIAACNLILERDRLPPRIRATALRFRGIALSRKREFDRAIADFSTALRIDPDDARLYNLRGVAYRRKGEYDNAIADYNAALRLNPRDSTAWNNRAVAYRWKGDYDRSIADANSAIRLDPDYALAYGMRSIAYRLKLDFPRAIADINEAIRIAPRESGAYYTRGATYEAMGDYAKALADFRHAASLTPQNKNYALAIGRIERRLTQPAVTVATAPPARIPAPAANNAPPAASAPPPASAPAAATPSAPAPSQQAALPPSATAARPEVRVALVIGNSSYRNTNPLPNPKKDAETLAAALKDVGFNEVTLKLDLSREQVLEALKAFAAQADRADWAVVYFAGHGMELSGTNYLIPVDAKLASDRDATFETVALDQVQQAVDGARKLKLIILDSCRDNPFLKTMTRSTARTRSVGKGLAAIEPEGATLIAYAAKHGQLALDGASGNSPFVSALVKHLPTPGLEINLLFRKVRDEVLGLTGKRQEPFTYGSLPSEPFYFRKQ